MLTEEGNATCFKDKGPSHMDTDSNSVCQLCHCGQINSLLDCAFPHQLNGHH